MLKKYAKADIKVFCCLILRYFLTLLQIFYLASSAVSPSKLNFGQILHKIRYHCYQTCFILFFVLNILSEILDICSVLLHRLNTNQMIASKTYTRPLTFILESFRSNKWVSELINHQLLPLSD